VIIYLVTVLGARLARVFPRWFCYAVAVKVSHLCLYLYSGKRKALEANLSRVRRQQEHQERSRLVRRVFENYAKYLVDFVLLRDERASDLVRSVSFDGLDEFEAAVREGKGVIFVTAHVGNWDVGAGALAALGYRVHVVADEFPDARMGRFVESTRAGLGVSTATTGKAGSRVLRALRRGEILAIALDRPDPKKGVWANFFGETVRVPAGPARLALRSGARIMPGVVVRRRGSHCGFEAHVEVGFAFEPSGNEEQDVQTLTQQILDRLEVYISRYPEQWYMFRPMWRSRRGLKQWPKVPA
jgi:KDO2-lipid IV(A) lauroyltransferase